MKDKKNTYVWFAGIGCLVLIVGTVFLGLVFWFFIVSHGGPSQGEIDEAKRKGDIIFSAIEEYRNENGSYPSALIDLVPNTLEEIPSPNDEDNFWIYSLKNNDTKVSLSHDWGGWHPAIFSNGNGWVVDTK